jgi:hypothetical protein
MYCNFISISESFAKLSNTEAIIYTLLDVLTVPGYMVSDWAFDMFQETSFTETTNIHTLASFISLTFESLDADMVRVFKSYILTKCIVSFALYDAKFVTL